MGDVKSDEKKGLTFWGAFALYGLSIFSFIGIFFVRTAQGALQTLLRVPLKPVLRLALANISKVASATAGVAAIASLCAICAPVTGPVAAAAGGLALASGIGVAAIDCSGRSVNKKKCMGSTGKAAMNLVGTMGSIGRGFQAIRRGAVAAINSLVFDNAVDQLVDE